MKNALITAMRLTHVLAALYNLTYIYYLPLHGWSHSFTVVQWVSTPLLMLTGAWLVHARRRAMAKATA